ncbi:hypothetical protein, partial [Streptomyces sp. NPDC007000]
LHPRTLPGPGRAWSGTRDLPAVPAEPFRDWWQRTRGAGGPPSSDAAGTPVKDEGRTKGEDGDR